MILATILCLCLPQDPPPRAGAGFEEASRIYSEVASKPVSGAATLEARLQTVQKRIEELQAAIEGATQSLVSLERQEMQHAMTIQTTFTGDERARRLGELEQTVVPKRTALEENRSLLERDLQGARDDLAQLKIEYDMVRAMQPDKRPRGAATPKIDERVLRYFRDKALALGLPEIKPLPSYWLEVEDAVR